MLSSSFSTLLRGTPPILSFIVSQKSIFLSLFSRGGCAETQNFGHLIMRHVVGASLAATEGLTRSSKMLHFE